MTSELIKVVLMQDALDWWVAHLEDSEGNSLATLNFHRDRESAEREAEQWIERWKQRKVDVVGGGYHD